MRRLQLVFRKEMTDHLRDRRSFVSGLMLSLLGPLMFGGLFSVIASWNKEGRTLEIPVVGRAHAPQLVSFLERTGGAQISEAPADFEQRIRDGALSFALVVPKEFPDDFARGEPAHVRLVFDGARGETGVDVRKMQRLLEAYGARIGFLRLMARGVSPQLAAAVQVDEEDVASAQKQAAKLLSMVPLFLLMAAFVGGMHVAIDSTAGERERGSLEPLLVNPVSRSTLVLGKWMSGVVIAWMALAAVTVGFILILARVPLQDLGIRATFGPREILGTLAAVAPLSLFSVALQMWVATFARSFKEAQTYTQLLVLLPTLPGVFLSLNPVKTEAWMMTVPMVGQYLLVNGTLEGEPLPGWYFAVACVSTLASAAVFLAAGTGLLKRERIIFGR
ncbi:MAG: ABC transporter permease [Myxococcaceae bacterium]